MGHPVRLELPRAGFLVEYLSRMFADESNKLETYMYVGTK